MTNSALLTKSKALALEVLSAPFQSFEDQALYPSLSQKAAGLGVGLVKKHPFLDGNNGHHRRQGHHVLAAIQNF